MEYKKLSDFAYLLNGYAFKSKNYTDKGIRIIRIANVQDGYIIDSRPCFYPQNTDENIRPYYLRSDDLLISLTGNVGRVGILTNEFLPAALNQRVGCIRIKDATQVNLKYLFYYLRRSKFIQDCINASKGVAQRNLSPKWIGHYRIPIPSYTEQERIVAYIEEQFSQLDNGVETLKKTKQQLAVYRQAVLKEAFEGASQSIKVSDVCSVVRGGSPRPAGDEKYYNGDIPFLKVADITNSKGMYLRNATYSIKKAGLSKTRLVPENTLMLSNSGATLGMPKICTFSTTFNDGIAAFIDFKRNEYLPFLYYFWLSKTAELRAINQGAAQPNLNTTIIGDTLMPDLSFEKEVETAQWIESRISVCDSIEQTIDTTLQQAEALRQSILKSAFEGGL